MILSALAGTAASARERVGPVTSKADARRDPSATEAEKRDSRLPTIVVRAQEELEWVFVKGEQR
jgi:hypothetical protein